MPNEWFRALADSLPQICEFLDISAGDVSAPEPGWLEVAFEDATDADVFVGLFSPYPAFLPNGEPVWKRIDRTGDATPATVAWRLPEGDVTRLTLVYVTRRYGPGMVDRLMQVEHGGESDVREVHPWVDDEPST